MKCPYCNREMESGYIISDGRALAWRKEKYESAIVKQENGIQLSHSFFGAATIKDVYCCKECKKIMFDYD